MSIQSITPLLHQTLGHGTSQWSYKMSATPSVNMDSQLTSAWGLTSSFPESQMVMSGYTSRLWPCDSQPQFWTKHQVWEWLQQVMDMYQIDASDILFQNFEMDGHQLCSLSYNDFIQAAGSVGPFLFHCITDLKWAGQHHVDVVQMDLEPENVRFQPREIYNASICPLKPLASPTSNPDIKRSSSCPDRVKDYTPRGTHLWEFIRDILLNPDGNPGLIKWEDRTQGIFRFLKSDAVAKLWGKKKNNSNMTYEKLSRAMRYYYKREILERVDGRRLVYKFGRNARGWRDEEN